jgi:hypothetical protein
MPLASIIIPEGALPDLKRIVELDDKLFSSLMSVIGEATPTLTREQFSSKISEKIKLPDEGDLPAVLRTAFVLYGFKERTGISTQELTQAVTDSEPVKKAEFLADKIEKLRSRLALLLGFDKSLGVTLKALDVMTEHERIFCRARILSDIRPVFAEELESAPAAMIIHNLQIGFHEYGRHHEYYFALDTDDIQKLKKIIERAEKKTIALQALLKKSNVRYLEV